MPIQIYKRKNVSELVRLAQQGDLKALEYLIRQTQKSIYTTFLHLINKHEDVADLTQEALLKMAKSISSLKDISKFKMWLNKIISNTFYDYLRKNPQEKIELDEKYLNTLKDNIECEPGEKCIISELEKLIKATILSMSGNLRITFILREFEGLSYDDIAKITHVSKGTVKSRISRARIKLQKELKGYI